MLAYQQTAQLPEIAAGTEATEIIRRGLETAAGPVALACSFSMEDVVIIDLLQRVAPQVKVFAIDTGRLPEETHEVAEALVERYGIEIDWYFPDRNNVEGLLKTKGSFSFRNSLEERHACCRIRKLEPLQRALAGLDGWLTGLRRAQSDNRQNIAALEIDEVNGGLLKINPLIEWNDSQLEDYVQQHRLPVNRLYHAGYTSIGCAPCTRAIAPGEHPRAGRWWWEAAEHKECGLHRRPGKAIPVQSTTKEDY